MNTARSSVLAALIAFGLFGCGPVADSGKEKTTEKKEPTPIHLSVKQLAAEYDADELALLRRYEGKYLEITGIGGYLEGEGPRLHLNYNNTSRDPTQFRELQCDFTERLKAAVAKVKTGQTVIVRGWFDGRTRAPLGDSLKLKRCDYLRVLE
jgi:hypothetical protein